MLSTHVLDTSIGRPPAGIAVGLFAAAPYFAARRISAFYDEITIRFRIEEPGEKVHVPLLLAPWGYSTYRGS